MRCLSCVLYLSVLVHAQIPSSDSQVCLASPTRVNALAVAIAHVEGYGKAGSLATRYHNPGNLKGAYWTGRIGKEGHAIFPNSTAGQVALRYQIETITSGTSRYYTLNTTITQMSRRYARNWKPWAKYVSVVLGITSNTKLVWLCSNFNE